MKQFLVCNPLKKEKLEEYKKFICELRSRQDRGEYPKAETTGILKANIWTKNINGKDHIIVYHEVTEDFHEKVKNFLDSNSPDAKWFKAKLLEFYQTDIIEDLFEESKQII